jgi:hypothetical protein
MRPKLVLCAVIAFAALLAVAAAGAATPAVYRAQVNAICRGYSPTLKQLEAQYNAAEKKKDQTGQGLALAQMFGAILSEDTRVESVPVPAALTATIAPLLKTLRTMDSHIRASKTRGPSELVAAAQLAGAVQKLYDNAGLRDCGSNQG